MNRSSIFEKYVTKVKIISYSKSAKDFKFENVRKNLLGKEIKKPFFKLAKEKSINKNLISIMDKESNIELLFYMDEVEFSVNNLPKNKNVLVGSIVKLKTNKENNLDLNKEYVVLTIRHSNYKNTSTCKIHDKELNKTYLVPVKNLKVVKNPNNEFKYEFN